MWLICWRLWRQRVLFWDGAIRGHSKQHGSLICSLRHRTKLSAPRVDLKWIRASVCENTITAPSRHSNNRSDQQGGHAHPNLSGLLRRSRADQQLVLESRCLSIINTPQSGLISLSDTLHSHFSTPSNVLRHRIWERWQQLWIATFFFFFFANKPGVSLASQQSKDSKFWWNNFFFLIKNEKGKADNLEKEPRLLFSPPNITGCTALLAAVSRCFFLFTLHQLLV